MNQTNPGGWAVRLAEKTEFFKRVFALGYSKVSKSQNQTDSALFKKATEFFSVALPSPTSLHGDVSI